MDVKKLALATTCAVALATATTPGLIAQASPPAHQDQGQQGEFDGDHQDTGAAAMDGKGGPEAAETPESQEAPESNTTRQAREPASVTEQANASPDTDRVQDSQADSIQN
jgi:hypothetical protein